MSRRSTMGRSTHNNINEHPSIEAQKALSTIATLYPVLERSLPREITGSAGRVTGNPETPLPYRESVSRMLKEIRDFTKNLKRELKIRSPKPIDETLALIARKHVGHFVPDSNENSQDFTAIAVDLAKRAETTAYPTPPRWVDVPNRADEGASRRDPMPCAEHGCPGHYRMRLDRDSTWGITIVDPKTWPPLTCKNNETHIVTGIELARAVAWARMNRTTHLDELRKWRSGS